MPKHTNNGDAAPYRDIQLSISISLDSDGQPIETHREESEEESSWEDGTYGGEYSENEGGGTNDVEDNGEASTSAETHNEGDGHGRGGDSDDVDHDKEGRIPKWIRSSDEQDDGDGGGPRRNRETDYQRGLAATLLASLPPQSWQWMQQEEKERMAYENELAVEELESEAAQAEDTDESED